MLLDLTDNQKWGLAVAIVVGIFTVGLGSVNLFYNPIYGSATQEVSKDLATWIAFSSTMHIVIITVLGLVTGIFALVKILDHFQEDDKK